MSKSFSSVLPTKSTLLLLSSLLLVLVLIPQHGQARPLTSAERQQLNNFLSEVMRCGNIPELSISLVGDGEVIHEQGKDNPSAKSSVSASKRTTRDTVFCLGSSTQAFTSVLLATLLAQNENKTFDTPLSDVTGSHYHLPGLFRTEMVNLKDILGMRTGLTNMDIVSTAMGMNRYRLIQNLHYAPEVKQFREDNVFSEVLFPLAEDAAIAMGGGGTWYQLLRQHIFNPLGMDNAGFVHLDAAQKDNVATPVVSYNSKYMPLDWGIYRGQELTAAATSVCASASDMSKWISFILSGGKDMNNQQLVDQNAIRSTFKSVQTRGNGGDPLASGFSQSTIQVSYTRETNALGWIKGQYRGYTFVSQDGSLPGFQSLTTILPTRNVGVFTAFTGDGGAKAYAAKVAINIFALDLLLHGQPWFNHQSVCGIMGKMIEHIKASNIQPAPAYLGSADEPIRPLEEYEGTYRHYGFGDVMVRRNESGLLTLHYGLMGNYTLHPTQRNDTFLINAVHGPLWYTTHADEYRKKGPHTVTFGYRNNDPNRRVETITIPHFDRAMNPEFSKNPKAPVDTRIDAACSGSDLSSVFWPLLVSCVLAVAGGLTR